MNCLATFDLKKAIETGATSQEIKPRRLYARNVSGKVRDLLKCFNDMRANGYLSHEVLGVTAVYYKLRKAVDAGTPGFGYDGKEFFLDAVQPDFNFFTHIGATFYCGENNITNLVQNGVWGNPDLRSPIYLAREARFVLPGINPNIDYAKLRVDAKELLTKRTLFYDPETLRGSSNHGDVLGNAYFVLGGIPKEAIYEYENFDDGRVVLKKADWQACFEMEWRK